MPELANLVEEDNILIFNSIRLDEDKGMLGYQLVLLHNLRAGLYSLNHIRTELRDGHINTQFIGNDILLKKAIYYTAMGQPYFVEGCSVTNCGGHQYLCPMDIIALEGMIQRYQAERMTCTKDTFIAIAMQVKLRRIADAKTMLRAFPPLLARAEKQADKLPPDDILEIFVSLTGFVFGPPQQVDDTRQSAANPDRLRAWYDLHAPLCGNAHPALVMNGDEMGTDANTGQLKVISHQADPVVGRPTKVSHITMMCAATASGVALPPLIILYNLQNLPQEFTIFQNIAWFASSKNGWMTEVIFYAWVHLLIDWVATYRTTLPGHLQDQWMFLFLDGHASRACPEALRLLHGNRIHLIILLSHTTHLTQPFDVGMAGPTRMSYHRFRRSNLSHLSIPHTIRTPTARLRYIVVDALIRSWYSSASVPTIIAAFKKAGIYPFDVQAALSSPFALDGPFPEPNRGERCVSGEHATDPAVMQRLERFLNRPQFPMPQHGSIFDDGLAPLNLGPSVTWLMMGTVARSQHPRYPQGGGVLLTRPTLLLPKAAHVNTANGPVPIWAIRRP